MVEPEQAPRFGRNESTEERMDRNWMELIQELRVLQTGVQILGGFLLTLPFQERFELLDDWQRSLYLFNVMVAALTTVLIVLPVSVHRRLFRRGLKAVLVSSADTITKWALAGVAILITARHAGLRFTAGRTAGLGGGRIHHLWCCWFWWWECRYGCTAGSPEWRGNGGDAREE